MTEPSVSEWRDLYRDELVKVDAIRMAEDSGARSHNHHVDRMQQAYLVLRETAEGRAAISALMHDPVSTVALWAASQALFWDEAEARARLASFIQSRDARSFEAEVTLREFDAGRLNMDWRPKGV